MQPQYNQQPGMQLPPPIAEQTPAGQPVEGQGAMMPEQGQPARAEQPNGPSAPMPMPTAIPAPAPPPMVAGQTPAQQGGATRATPSLPADDGDLIEKEWVLKAKAIVDRTRDDPYKQSEELTGVKADYMKKRYNKVIKLSK